MKVEHKTPNMISSKLYGLHRNTERRSYMFNVYMSFGPTDESKLSTLLSLATTKAHHGVQEPRLAAVPRDTSEAPVIMAPA